MSKNKHLMVVDITSAGVIRIGLLDGLKLIKVRRSTYTHGSSFLMYITKYLTAHNLKENLLQGIALIEGVGSFSAARAGVAVLSTLQWTKNVSVAVFDCRAYKDEKEIFSAMANFKWSQKHSPVLPIYQYEPHITTPKKMVL